MERRERLLDRRVPLYVVLPLIIGLAATNVLTGLAVSQLTVKVPAMAELVSVSSDLAVESFVPGNYDPPTNRWMTASVGVRNNGGIAASGTVYVYLYNGTGTLICQGTVSTGSITPGSAVSVTVPLSWVGTYTISNFVNGRVVVQQT